MEAETRYLQKVGFTQTNSTCSTVPLVSERAYLASDVQLQSVELQSLFHHLGCQESTQQNLHTYFDMHFLNPV